MTTTTAPKSTARKPAARKPAGTGRKPAGGEPAAPKPVAGKPEPKPTVTECERCGFKFPKPQTRTTCRVEAACEKRQAKRTEAAAAALAA